MAPGCIRAHNFGVAASAALGGWVVSADGGLKLNENADGTRVDVKRAGNPLRRAGGPRRLHRPAAVQRVSRAVSPSWPRCATTTCCNLAPRAELRLSDYVSAAAGANLWFSWKPGIASGLLGRDDAKDNVFAQLVVRYSYPHRRGTPCLCRRSLP